MILRTLNSSAVEQKRLSWNTAGREACVHAREEVFAIFIFNIYLKTCLRSESCREIYHWQLGKTQLLFKKQHRKIKRTKENPQASSWRNMDRHCHLKPTQTLYV